MDRGGSPPGADRATQTPAYLDLGHGGTGQPGFGLFCDTLRGGREEESCICRQIHPFFFFFFFFLLHRERERERERDLPASLPLYIAQDNRSWAANSRRISASLWGGLRGGAYLSSSSCNPRHRRSPSSSVRCSLLRCSSNALRSQRFISHTRQSPVSVGERIPRKGRRRTRQRAKRLFSLALVK